MFYIVESRILEQVNPKLSYTKDYRINMFNIPVYVYVYKWLKALPLTNKYLWLIEVANPG